MASKPQFLAGDTDQRHSFLGIQIPFPMDTMLKTLIKRRYAEATSLGTLRISKRLQTGRRLQTGHF